MASGFVSGGTNEEPIERDDEWQRAQQELEEQRKRKADLGKQDGGKSLFEILENNKMAKQEAFEEKIKLKNQFRSLDEDEVEFLDSLLESTRAQEDAVKKDTADQLEVFRRQREEAEKALLEDTSTDVAPAAEAEDWKIPSRKRRREKKKDSLIPGKKRKSTAESTGEEPFQTEQKTEDDKPAREDEKKATSESALTGPATSQKELKSENSEHTRKLSEDTKAMNAKPSEAPKPAVSLGLAEYGSDSE